MGNIHGLLDIWAKFQINMVCIFKSTVFSFKIDGLPVSLDMDIIYFLSQAIKSMIRPLALHPPPVNGRFLLHKLWFGVTG